MSTGYEQPANDYIHISFNEIDRSVQEFDVSAFMCEGVVQQEAPHVQRLTVVYPKARLILAALAATPLIPQTWSAVLNLLMAVLDQVTANFKAGKDLAVGDGGASANMEPKLPA